MRVHHSTANDNNDVIIKYRGGKSLGRREGKGVGVLDNKGARIGVVSRDEEVGLPSSEACQSHFLGLLLHYISEGEEVGVAVGMEKCIDYKTKVPTPFQHVLVLGLSRIAACNLSR